MPWCDIPSRFCIGVFWDEPSHEPGCFLGELDRCFSTMIHMGLGPSIPEWTYVWKVWKKIWRKSQWMDSWSLFSLGSFSTGIYHWLWYWYPNGKINGWFMIIPLAHITRKQPWLNRKLLAVHRWVSCSAGSLALLSRTLSRHAAGPWVIPSIGHPKMQC